MIAHRNRSTEGLPKIHVFNTFFYRSFVTNGYAGVRSWTQNTNIFENDILLVPIHDPTGIGHWSVAAVFNQEKEIRLYDSLDNGNYLCIGTILVYLEAEYESRYGVGSFDFDLWSLVIKEGLPSQQNSYDCGVFCCKYADFIASKSEITFEQNSIPFFRKLMIFEVVKGSLWSRGLICHICKESAVLYDGSRTRGRPKKHSKPGFPCSTCRKLFHLSCMSKLLKDSIYGFKPSEKTLTCDSCQKNTVQIEITAQPNILNFG